MRVKIAQTITTPAVGDREIPVTHTITIEVSDKIYAQRKRTAELTRRSNGRRVTQSLVQSISPLIEDISLNISAMSIHY